MKFVQYGVYPAGVAHSYNLVAESILAQYGYKNEEMLAADLDLLFEGVA